MTQPVNIANNELTFEGLKKNLVKGLDKELAKSIVGIIETYEAMGKTPREALDAFAELYMQGAPT